MKLLAIDATEDACSAALLLDGEVVERFEVAPRRHSELILPMMDGLLSEAGLRLEQLDALGFARGPGSFTGLRIAVAVTQGAALGAGLPVVAVSSLQALAAGCLRLHGAEHVLAAFDARMNEVYSGFHVLDETGVMRLVGEERVCPAAQIETPPEQNWTGAGSAWLAYADTLSETCRPGAVFAELRPHAQDVARIAAHQFAAGQHLSAEQALPVYLRDQVAWAKP